MVGRPGRAPDTIRCPAPRTARHALRRRPAGQTADRRTDGRCQLALRVALLRRQSRLSVVRAPPDPTDGRRFLNIAQHAAYVHVEPVHAARTRRAQRRPPPPTGFLCVDHWPPGGWVDRPATTRSTSTIGITPAQPSDHPPGTERRQSKRYRTRTHPRRTRLRFDNRTAAAAAARTGRS